MDVAEYLQITDFDTEELVQWGEMTLCVRASDTMVLPPPTAVSSVRGMLLRASKVMVVEDPDRKHLLPGGRCEAGESYEATLRREVLEETGYEVGELERIGVLHFEHRTPDPGGWASQHYPHFFQVIYGCRAGECVASKKQTGGYKLAAEFRDWPYVQKLTLMDSEKFFVPRAVHAINGALAARRA